MAIGTYIPIMTLNINGLNAETKRHRLAEWIQKQDPYICCLQQTHFRPHDTYRLKVRKLIFSDHKAMRLDINYKKKKTVKNTNTWRLNNIFPNNQQVLKKLKEKSKNF